MPFWRAERLCECEDQFTVLENVFAVGDTVRMLYWNGARSRQDAHPNSEYLSVSLR
jgi:hypothetical protein